MIPLDSRQRELIRELVCDIYQRCAARYGCESHAAEIEFNLRGRSAGQWRLVGSHECLRFNPHIFAVDWETHFPDTVAHEVAHSIVFRRFGRRHVRPHGAEWRQVMQDLGFEARTTHQTDLSLVPLRKVRYYAYRCACRIHALGPRRHRVAQRGRHGYYCRACGARLRYTPDEALP